MPKKEIISKLKAVRCFIFDWDGVFNDGVKTNSEGSSFSEPDSMGLNMLRFSYWLLHDALPVTGIITGENNISALRFAKREHLHAVLLNTKNKKNALIKLTIDLGVSPGQTLFVFDDILDLGAAEISLFSICVNRNASPFFKNFVIKNKLCDYMTGNAGGENAIREIAELIIGLNGNYDKTIAERMKQKGNYETYLLQRNAIEPVVDKLSDNKEQP